MFYEKKVNQLQIRNYKKKLTITMDKSLLSKNRLEKMAFFLLFCFVFTSVMENAPEENDHSGCGN